MSRSELGQVVDPATLDAADGARGRLRVAVPEAWAAEQADIELTAPARVPCARCDGGGCDGCERSGAHRTPADPSARTVRLRLPERLGDGVALRLVRPFGDAAPLEQLFVEIVAGPEPSAGVARVAPLPPALPPGPSASAARARAPALIFLALVVLAIVAVVLANR